jgi:hypothetical protein
MTPADAHRRRAVCRTLASLRVDESHLSLGMNRIVLMNCGRRASKVRFGSMLLKKWLVIGDES